MRVARRGGCISPYSDGRFQFPGEGMLGRATVVAGLAGVLGAHRLADLPGGGTLTLASCVLGVAGWAVWRAHARAAARPGRARAGVLAALRGPMLCLLSAWSGFVFSLYCAPRRAPGSVAGRNQCGQGVARHLACRQPARLPAGPAEFEAVVLDAHPSGVPERIRVRWPAGGWRGPYAPARSRPKRRFLK